jgi:hypothetical protein
VWCHCRLNSNIIELCTVTVDLYSYIVDLCGDAVDLYSNAVEVCITLYR